MRWLRWTIGLVAILGLALALQAGLVAFAAYVILGVLFLSRYLAREWIASITAERTVHHHPREAGESEEVIVRLTNHSRWPIPWLLVEDILPVRSIRKPNPALVISGSRLRVLFFKPGQTRTIRYTITFARRGYFAIGPMTTETGDVFGLHRRHRVLTIPEFVMVYPKLLPITQFNFASERPIGEIRLANRLFEDPTRTAGVRPYVYGDPLQRVHWRATARTGQLHSRIYEPTSLAGATVLIDFHEEGYPQRGEPYRSELAVTAATALSYAVSVLNQQVGLASNGRDAVDRIRVETLSAADRPATAEFATRLAAREGFELKENDNRLNPVVVPTRRGLDQFQQIREPLARLELTNGMTFDRLVLEMLPRLPRDATVICLLPRVPVETSLALGHLRRQGFAVSVLLIGLADDGSDARVVAAGRLLAEGIRDVRFVNTETELMAIGDRSMMPTPSEYGVSAALA
ncbi:MAG: DUF58 domain-containing protein [Gemmataceae bacterium]